MFYPTKFPYHWIGKVQSLLEWRPDVTIKTLYNIDGRRNRNVIQLVSGNDKLLTFVSAYIREHIPCNLLANCWGQRALTWHMETHQLLKFWNELLWDLFLAPICPQAEYQDLCLDSKLPNLMFYYTKLGTHFLLTAIEHLISAWGYGL